MKNLITFTDRLAKIGISTKMGFNFPWIYLEEINGKVVMEKFRSDHRFTLAYAPIKRDDDAMFDDLTETFKLIRKYC